jgi:hypothetical protein
VWAWSVKKFMKNASNACQSSAGGSFFKSVEGQACGGGHFIRPIGQNRSLGSMALKRAVHRSDQSRCQIVVSSPVVNQSLFIEPLLRRDIP